MLDLLIINGEIIDGTGSPGFKGSILVKDERITIERGSLTNIEAHQTIDANGQVVCPGFIDLHSHAGLTILGEPHHDPKIRQGVTTELVGIDGISHTPFKSKDDLDRYRALFRSLLLVSTVSGYGILDDENKIFEIFSLKDLY